MTHSPGATYTQGAGPVPGGAGGGGGDPRAPRDGGRGGARRRLLRGAAGRLRHRGGPQGRRRGGPALTVTTNRHGRQPQEDWAGAPSRRRRPCIPIAWTTRGPPLPWRCCGSGDVKLTRPSGRAVGPCVCVRAAMGIYEKWPEDTYAPA